MNKPGGPLRSMLVADMLPQEVLRCSSLDCAGPNPVKTGLFREIRLLDVGLEEKSMRFLKPPTMLPTPSFLKQRGFSVSATTPSRQRAALGSVLEGTPILNKCYSTYYCEA